MQRWHVRVSGCANFSRCGQLLGLPCHGHVHVSLAAGSGLTDVHATDRLSLASARSLGHVCMQLLIPANLNTASSLSTASSSTAPLSTDSHSTASLDSREVITLPHRSRATSSLDSSEYAHGRTESWPLSRRTCGHGDWRGQATMVLC